MKFHNNAHSLRALFLSLCLTICLIPSVSWGESEDNEDATDLFSAWQEQDVTISRVPKPLSQTAENVTVITAADIRALNAHTLDDILNTIPGIQLQHNGGPGITSYTYIQSTDYIYTQVFVDGVSISALPSNYTDVSLIPAQIIDRVEIIKGAASASWGSALGGVINVITKSPEKERAISGSATASIGERTTADTSAQLSGTTGKVGYFFSGGYLGSNGLLPTMQIGSNHAYAKLTYDLPKQGLLWGTFGYIHANMGDLYVPIHDYDLKERNVKSQKLASIGLRYHLTDSLELELTGRHYSRADDTSYFNISDGLLWQYQAPELPTASSREQTFGSSAKLIWRGYDNLLVAGSDYNHHETQSNSVDASTLSPFTRTVDRWGIYLNDTLTLGPMSLSPSVRLDHTQTSGDQVSYSLGATYQLTDSTLLRAYTGRGYGLPLLLATDSPSAKIWTSQFGAESSAIPYLWVKATLFRNETWNVVDGSNLDYTIPERRVALGTELEVRTVPLFNTSLGTGYTFTETTRTADGSFVYSNNIARHTLKMALRYDDKTFRGVLSGQYLYWNSAPDDFSKPGLLWDLHLGATLLKRENSSLELFFSGHNLFDGTQYNRDVFPNVGRWFEGGVRVNF
ncbi:MAG: TonB-dependent receptor plug domain-containing protein [Desulfuromonadaceae bacterium]|nr:TonB-dependent receptor plug domain-containing protein [Desulfuromonadaceae bacterium]